MPAIVSDGDHLCLQSRIFLNRVLTQDDHFQGILKIFEIAGIYGPHRIRLQAYMVPIVTGIAGIFGPYLDQNCRHNRSPPILFFLLY